MSLYYADGFYLFQSKICDANANKSRICSQVPACYDNANMPSIVDVL